MPKVEESMRELIFRGKRIDNGEWVEGYYIEDKWGDSNNNQLHFILPHRTCPSILDDWQPIKVIPETVGQFTGLTDKNGKKIFEGDVLRFTDRRVWYTNKLFMLSESEKIKKLADFIELPYIDRVVEIPRIYDWCFESDKSYWEIIKNIHDKEEL